MEQQTAEVDGDLAKGTGGKNNKAHTGNGNLF